MEGLRIRNVTKTYSFQGSSSFVALDNINLDIEEGEFVSIVGSSGSGKSTLAKLLVGIEKPTSGNVYLDDEDVTLWDNRQWRKRRPKIQAVFQDTSGTLNPKLSVYHNIEQALVNLTDLDKGQRFDRIHQLMDLTNMSSKLLKVPTRQLSGGEQRRLSLLRALSVRPRYLVLDEVISGLDLLSADAVMRVLETYHSQFQYACVFITHNEESAYRLSDRIVVMKDGKLVKEGKKLRSKEQCRKKIV